MRFMLPIMLPVENALSLCVKGFGEIHVRCWTFLNNLSFNGLTLPPPDSKIRGMLIRIYT